MDALLDLLEVVQAVVFVALAAVATSRWFRHKSAARAWLAATFGVLATISVLGLVLSDDPAPGSAGELIAKCTVSLIGLFPYFLFRFGATFRRRPRVVEGAALAATVVSALGIFVIGDIPKEGEAWPPAFAAWAMLLLGQWVVLSGIVAVELWMAGRGQPTVSRRRMRVMSVAAVALAFALVLTASVGNGTARNGTDVAIMLFAIAVGPLFLIGFAPPQILLSAWRRPELDDLRAAEEVLLRALSPSDVGARLLPHVTRIIGGEASALFDSDGTLLGIDGIEEAEAEAAFGEAHAGELITLPVRNGRLVVRVSPYTPYFARSEADLLTRLATFADLALSRAELSERERQTAIELQAANEAMREFVAIASHDLRTPVTVIKGFASTLESEWVNIDDPQRQQYLATIRRHAEHLGVIIDDLLTTSRVDAGVLEPAPRRVELAPFLQRVVGDLSEGSGVTIEAASDLFVRVDPEHLQRMVTNYLVNAARYGAPPISVRAWRCDDDVEIVVCDCGDGVPEEFEGRVFEKFARVDKRHSREHHGTGLGLAIVRGLAQAAGGDAWYRRNQPRGACFGIVLPSAGPPAPTPD